jgi:hypothetical protein
VIIHLLATPDSPCYVAHVCCSYSDGRDHALTHAGYYLPGLEYLLAQVLSATKWHALSGCLAKRLITTVTVYFAEEIALSICDVAELVCFVTDGDYVNVFVQVPHRKNFNCCVNWI